MTDDIERDKMEDRAYRNGFVEACREWNCLIGADFPLKLAVNKAISKMGERVDAVRDQYTRGCRDFGLRP